MPVWWTTHPFARQCEQGIRHRRRNAQDESHVERCRDQIFGAEVQLLTGVSGGHFVTGLGLGQRGDLVHAGQLHLFGDLGRAAVQRTTEDVGKAQDVVDLVRIVAAAGGDDAVRPHLLGQFGPDLGLGVGQRQDDRLRSHRPDHVCGQHASRRTPQENVGVLHHVGQRLRVGFLAVTLLAFVELVAAAFADHALGVADEDVFVLETQAHHHVEAGDGRRAGAGDGQLHVADRLAHQFQPVQHRGGRNDGSAVLVVMKHRDVHALAQLALDIEALGRLDVLEVDAAKRGLERGDDVDQLVGIVFGEFDVEDVDPGEFLEQAALAFHHRFAGQRPDVAQSQHRGAVGDHADQIGARRVFGRQRRIFSDRQTGIGHAR